MKKRVGADSRDEVENLTFSITIEVLMWCKK